MIGAETCVAFYECHTEPLLEGNNDAGVNSMAHTPAPDCNQAQSGEASSFIVKIEEPNTRTGHPFGTSNPPDSVCKVYARILRDQGGWRDYDIVEGFANQHTYNRLGMGQLEITSTRFRVRRAGEVPFEKRWGNKRKRGEK